LSDLSTRLARCFASVFPDVGVAEIPSASVDTVAEWDSLAAVTLMAVVEQEFGVRIDELDLPELGSFTAFRDYLHAMGVS
jgi:acyl carrier protein